MSHLTSIEAKEVQLHWFLLWLHGPEEVKTETRSDILQIIFGFILAGLPPFHPATPTMWVPGPKMGAQ